MNVDKTIENFYINCSETKTNFNKMPLWFRTIIHKGWDFSDEVFKEALKQVKK